MRVYLEAFGCSQNQGEGAAIGRDLSARGHELVPAPEGADASVLVTCGVIGPTEARMLRRWRTLAATTPRVIVTGCLVPLRTDLFDGPARGRTSFVPIREQDRLAEHLAGPPTRTTVPAGPEDLCRKMHEEVVLAQGCTSGCAYCFSRLARGRLASVPLPDVLARVRSAVARGVREIRLTGLDTAAWGEDVPGGPRLPELVRAAALAAGDARLRVGMMSPQSLAARVEEHAGALCRPGPFRFVHLPVQSGSDSVLSAMHRGYTVGEFRREVAVLRARLPDLHLATDVIVGYPGETEDDHRATEALLEEIGPETVNVTRFSSRPGTPAARLPPLEPRVAKRRSRSLARLRQRLARDRLERWIGERRPGRVLEYGPGTSSVARLDNYLPVVLPSRPPLGADVEIRIDGARSNYLLGRPAAAPLNRAPPP